MYEKMARNVASNKDGLQIALIAVPPYGRGPVSRDCPCTLGLLAGTKEWFVTTPAVALITDGHVLSAWEEEAPDFETINRNLTKMQKQEKDSIISNKARNIFAVEGRRSDT